METCKLFDAIQEHRQYFKKTHTKENNSERQKSRKQYSQSKKNKLFEFERRKGWGGDEVTAGAVCLTEFAHVAFFLEKATTTM